jgi:NADH-quinone oxidoreductase subunit N
MLCLAGVPPFYGFAAKLAVITAFAEAGMEYLALIAAAFFVVAATYNLRFIIERVKDVIEKPAPIPLYIYSLILLVLGVAPSIVYALGGGV